MIEMISEWSQITDASRHDYWIRGDTNLQNDLEPFCGYKPGRNALFKRSTHSDGSEVIEINVSDKAPWAMVVDRGDCGKRSDEKKQIVSVNKPFAKVVINCAIP